MRIDLSKYDLTEAPFFPNSQINLWSNDPRLNGQLFCEEIVSKEAKKLMSLIHRQRNVIYVNSSMSVLGTGKSALMAHVYWKLTNNGALTVWTEATGGLSTSPTLGRIVDSMVAQGVFEKIKTKMVDITYEHVAKRVKLYYRFPAPGLIGALTKILKASPEETAKKFVNIRRSIPSWSPSNVFGYLLALMESCGMEKPIIFLDQFEEFVRSHLGPTQLRRLANDFNDLIRAIQNRAILVVSLHPEAERVLMSAAGEYVQTIAPINEETMVIVKPLTTDDAIKLTLFYLKHYRMGKKEVPELYPFSENVLKYICIKTNGTPRKFITALYDALMVGAMQNYVPIDEKFISDENNHRRVLPGASNDWEKFIKGALK